MNNALRHTALTLAAASALLVLVALPSQPDAPSAGLQGRGALPTAASTDLGPSPSTTPSALPLEDSAMEASQRVIRKSARHRRQTLVMPFFSFAQRG